MATLMLVVSFRLRNGKVGDGGVRRLEVMALHGRGVGGGGLGFI